MDGYMINIEEATLNNEYYRHVLYTTKQNQIVLMSIQPQDDIPLETHDDITQFIRIESGKGLAIIGSKTYELKDGIALDIPSGTPHRIINTSDTKSLKLYTVYSPPEHPDKLLQIYKPLSEKRPKRPNKSIFHLLNF